ncbi:hypothetical protein FKP32DRAFT_1670737, partial [Trametes sanguinea]
HFSGDSHTGEFYLLLVPLETLLSVRLTTGDRPSRGSVVPWERTGALKEPGCCASKSTPQACPL